MNEIEKICVDGIGWIYSTDKHKIEAIKKNGEMALIDWYKFDNTEYNSKFVVAVVYKNIQA